MSPKELRPAATVIESRELADGLVRETVQLSASRWG